MNTSKRLGLLSLFLMTLVHQSLAIAGDLTVQQLTPQPTYSLTFDSGDMAQLTDGNTLNASMWVNINSVGWKAQSVQIDFANSSQAAGHFEIHVGKGTGGQVFVPQRVDLYGSNDQTNYVHLASSIFKASQYPDPNSNGVANPSYWITLPGTAPYAKMVAVIWANGVFVMADEVRWTPLSLNETVTSPSANSIARNALLADSKVQLKNEYAAEAAPTTIKQGWTTSFGSNTTVWLNPQWQDVERFPTSSYILQHPLGNGSVKMRGLSNDRVAINIGILNPTTTSRTVTVAASAQSSLLSFSQLQPILAGNGSTPHDPIQKLSTNQLTLPPSQASYLWVTADLSQLTAGGIVNTNINITDSSGGQIASVPIQIESVRLPTTTTAPYSTVWGYLKEGLNVSPIWQNPQKALQDQIAHGTNVFVVHPQSIPKPGQQDNSALVSTFEGDVNFYKGKGKLILLFINAKDACPSGWSDPALSNWVTWLTSKMNTDLGLAYSEWALYPLDEPGSSGTPLACLKTLATQIKSKNANINIYANPVSNQTTPTTVQSLSDISNLIDFWQPFVGLFNGYSATFTTDNNYKAFFASTGKPWWIFSIGNSPVKAIAPFSDRRMLGWTAASVGARGAGIWSYSDVHAWYSPNSCVTECSAWDDFDSYEPDWAIVYEDLSGQGQPVTSRRWEAYREGLQDLRLLAEVKAIGGVTPVIPTDEVALDSARNSLLDYLKNYYGGLTANYFNNKHLTGSPTLTRIDQTIDFNWGLNSPAVGVINDDFFSVKWTGKIMPPVSGTYTFCTNSDDGVVLSINSVKVIDKWLYQSATTWCGTTTLTQNQLATIELDFFDREEHAVARLFWSYPGQSLTIVPSSRLYPQ